MYALLNVLIHLDQIEHSLLLTQGNYLYSLLKHTSIFSLSSIPFHLFKQCPRKWPSLPSFYTDSLRSFYQHIGGTLIYFKNKEKAKFKKSFFYHIPLPSTSA